MSVVGACLRPGGAPGKRSGEGAGVSWLRAMVLRAVSRALIRPLCSRFVIRVLECEMLAFWAGIFQNMICAIGGASRSG